MTTLRKVLPFTLLCAALFQVLPLAAQTQDTSFTYTFTGDGTYTVSNLSKNTPSVNWRITLSVTGTLSTTATFYTSPDNVTFTAVPNTVCSATVQPPCVLQGANPIVGTQGMMYLAAYGSYVRVVTSSSSGTGSGTIRGYGVKGASAAALPPNGGGGGSGTVTSVGFTGGIVTVNTPTTTPALIISGTSGGIPYFTSASTWATSAVLGLNRVVLGGGAGGAPTVTAADTTPTHALFATAGAPAFRAITSADLPSVPGATACPENPISMTATNTYTCTDNLGVATGKFLWCQDPNSTPVNAAVQVSWAGATINTFTWVASTTETVNCYASLGGGSGGGGGGILSGIGTFAALPASGTNTGDLYRATDGPFNFVWDGSVWQAFAFGVPVTLPTTATLNVQTNVGTSTADGTRGGVLFTNTNGPSPNIALWTKTLAAHSAVFFFLSATNAPTNTNGSGLFVTFRESATGKLIDFAFNSEGPSMTININHFSSPTAYSSTPYNNVPYYLFASGPMLAIRLRTDASNLYFDLSGTMGRTWTQIYTEAKTTFFTVGPDQQGIGLNTTGAALYLYSYTEN